LGQVSNAASTAPVGTIISQSPAPGAPADAATAVDVTAAAPLQVTVPDLTGMTLDIAQAAVTQADLTLAVAGTQPSPSAPGTVVSQNPTPGSQAVPGATVSVTTAVPVPTQQQVPDLVGMDQITAQNALAPTGLTLNVTGQQPDPSQAVGTVLTQDPPAGSMAAPGTAVDVVVVAPPSANTVIVPDVRGSTQPAATAALTGAGLTVTTLTQASSGPAGTVLSQSPLPQSRVPTGSAVSITVSVPPLVTVPDVTGFTQGAADAQIRGLGLVPIFISQGGGIGFRQVVAQRPPAGSLLAAGSNVIMTVSPLGGGGGGRGGGGGPFVGGGGLLGGGGGVLGGGGQIGPRPRLLS
jgi:serine/threonine-protein kinase